MKNKKHINLSIIIIGFILITFVYFLIIDSQTSLSLAKQGLIVWFRDLIPTLFPFMIVTSLLTRLNLSAYLARIIAPLFRIYRINYAGIYCILMGFLCGFPMGAKVITEELSLKHISREEAQYLLSFCNNIGPVYFLGFVLPYIGYKANLSFLFGMYGIPLCYGLLLRYTIYKQYSFLDADLSVKITQNTKLNYEKILSLFIHIDESMEINIENILKLGGYMIIFNTSAVCFYHLNFIPDSLISFLIPFMEISNGIKQIPNEHALYILSVLSFGGLCCIAQTYCFIKHTSLSIKKYIYSKISIALLSIAYYFLILR